MELGGGYLKTCKKGTELAKWEWSSQGALQGSSQGALKDQHVQAERLLLRAEYSGVQIHYN